MKFFDLKREIEAGNISSIYLFEGEDVFFREHGFSTLKNKFVSEPSINVSIFTGETNEDEINASLMAFPFMSEKRITLIREFYPKADSIKKLSWYLENPAPDSLLIILNEKSFEALKKYPSVCVVNCDYGDTTTLARWVKKTASESSISIEMETAIKVVEYCQADMTRISNETEKLISYAIKKGEIDLDDVSNLVSKTTDYKIYEMTEFIGKKNFDGALTVISDMLSKGETQQRIIVSIYNYFRRLLHVGISKETNAELASLLGIKEFAVKKAKEQAKAFSVKNVKKAVDLLADCDYKIKSGKMSASEGMWLSIFKIMTV